MPNSAELLKLQTEAVERMIALDHFRSIKRGDEDIDDVIRQYEEMTPPHKSVKSQTQ